MKFTIEDLGPVLKPDQPGEKYFESDGGGIREAIVHKVNDSYYLFYDGAAAHTGECLRNDPERHLWRACLAKSKDMINWEKLGPRLRCGYDDFLESSGDEFLDFWSASSPWVYFDRDADRWHMFYLGAKGAFPSGIDAGTPSTDYNTLYAFAETKGLAGVEGRWIQTNRAPGNHKAVSFYKSGDKAIYPWDTTSPGSVIENPRWQGPGDKANKRYMMFITSGWTIGIARTDNLAATQAYDGPKNPNGWTLEGPILSRGMPENAHYFHDKKSGLHFLFCNRIAKTRTYADAVMVYWSRDPNIWSDDDCQVLIDATNTKDGWASGAIGMPSAAPLSDDVLGILYDAVPGNSLCHSGRQIALARLYLPR